MDARLSERVLREIDACRDEIVDFCVDLVRLPTVNPPGEGYRECAELVGKRLERCGFEVAYHEAEERAEHTRAHPRVNVVGRLAGAAARPLVHLNGHMDVVPPGNGWTFDPFAAVVKDGRLYGRGSADMKAGLAAAVYAVEALRRAGAELRGSVEVSGTVDEESGGQAGMGYLCERGIVGQARTDYVIIPEPLNVDRVCVGHRGVYWFKVTAHGKIAHGSMPFLGSSAIDHMARFIELCRTELAPLLYERVTAMPVVPPGARHATLNVNSIAGGQAGREPQTPCVADRCEAIFDRRFLLEEGFEAAKSEIARLLERASDGDARHFALDDLLVFHPVKTPDDSPLVASLERAVQSVLGKPAMRVASPGTYDHKHVARIGGVEQCVAYGPGILELAHQTDEYVELDDLVNATKVLALAVGDLV
jgi:succinyl-diaminopimelate desuccinylase